jgi:hypothetical protein
MNRLLAALALGALLLGAIPGLAEDKKDKDTKPAEKITVDKDKIQKEQVSFKTFDGLLLKGTFYPSPKGGSSPVVMFLHKLGSKRTEGDWESLAAQLQVKGYAVLSFDFRGHGDSTTINDPNLFWSMPYNQTYIKNWALTKKKLEYKDFSIGYVPYLLNDIAAARWDLDNRNDNGQCNSSNIIVVGAEDGAALGFAWIMCEYYRPQIYKEKNPLNFGGGVINTDPAGDDIAGAVWLSYKKYPGIGTATIGEPYGLWADRGLLNPLRDNVQMWFAHGAKDMKGKSDADYMFKDIIRGADKKRAEKLPLSSNLAIEGTQLRGVALLGKKELTTEERIFQFIEKAVKMRPNQSQKKRNASEFKPAFIDPTAIGFR